MTDAQVQINCLLRVSFTHVALPTSKRAEIRHQIFATGQTSNSVETVHVKK